MVFSSVLFLFAFLPLFVLVYHVTPNRGRNLVALLFSLVFYAWGAPVFVHALLLSTWLDHHLSRRIHDSTGPRRRRLLLVSLTVNIGLLLYFKYAEWFVQQFDGLMTFLGFPSLTWAQINLTVPVSPFDLANTLLHTLGMPAMPWQQVLLPIGISFFTFHKISYVVDVYRGQAQPTRTFGECLLYLILFPQLIAGPIIRYHDIDEQIRSRPYSVAMFWRGLERFALGLGKKLLLANAMAEICDPLFRTDPEYVPTFYAWLAAVTYYFQIYFDFSGYSDMAIGLGRMMGFEFRENFDRPYTATTFTEFWRRWHISLSNFMREYVYIPLGGNRVGPLRGYVNLWIVFLLSGFWHGASWTFIVWGAYQGLFLTIDRLGWSNVAARLPRLPLRLSMVFLVTVSWVVFRADDMPRAVTMLERMFCGGGPRWYEFWHSVDSQLDGYARAMLVAAAVGAFLPWSRRYLALEQRFLAWRTTPKGAPVAVALVVLLLLLSGLKVVNSAHNPFIYFRF